MVTVCILAARQGKRRRMYLDQEELARLHARGIDVAADGQLVPLAGFAGPAADDLIRFLNNRREDSDTEAVQRMQWVENLRLTVDTLSTEAMKSPWPLWGIFWIRLGGLWEIRRWAIGHFDRAGVDARTHQAVGVGRIFQQTVLRIDALATRLSEDEHVYADYRRQTEAHPTQGQYTLQWDKRQGRLKEERGIPGLNGKVMLYADRMAAIHSVLGPGADEHGIAIDFARRIRSDVPPVLAALRALAGRPAG